MVESGIFDMRLPRAIEQGVDALPADLRVLKDYLGFIQALLGEKACEYEQTWDQAVCAGVEVLDLHLLEEAVAERAATVPARCLGSVLEKLAIWRAMTASDGDRGDIGEEPTARDRLVLSIEADIEALARRGKA